MVYVANSRSNSVTAVDVDNNNQITTISVGTSPSPWRWIPWKAKSTWQTRAAACRSSRKQQYGDQDAFDSTAITPSAVVASEYNPLCLCGQQKGSNTISLIQAPYTAITGGYAVGSSPVALATNLANKRSTSSTREAIPCR